MTAPVSRRFLDTTRGQILTLLRAGARTVEQLRAELGLTDNAVRPHLTGLERDGLVRQAGHQRRSGAGKPAVLFELDPAAEQLLSRAYAPALAALAEVLAETLQPREVRRVLREAGRRLASDVGARASGDLHARTRAAAVTLGALGATVDVELKRGSAAIRGTSCPLASAVSRNPSVCQAMVMLVEEITGAQVSEACDRSAAPRCGFALRGPLR